MKIPINKCAVIDLNAPVLPTYTAVEFEPPGTFPEVTG